MSELSDPARFEQLFRSTRNELLTYLRRRCESADDAADALAETYAIAWQKLDAIPNGEAGKLWLYGVARKVHLRGVRRRRVAHAVVTRLASVLAAEPLTQPIDDGLSEALKAALSGLGQRDREILLLNAWEELSPHEIATVLNMSPNAIRIRLHRARTRVTRELDLRTPRSHTTQDLSRSSVDAASL